MTLNRDWKMLFIWWFCATPYHTCMIRSPMVLSFGAVRAGPSILLYMQKHYSLSLRNFIAWNRHKTGFEDRSLFLSDSGDGTARFPMSTRVFAACLLARLLTARQFSFQGRAVLALRDAEISERWGTVLSAAAQVAPKVRDDEFSANMLSFTTEPSAPTITINSFISDNLIRIKLTGKWESPP